MSKNLNISYFSLNKPRNSPLTCCSSVIITSTAILRMPSFVCGLSDLRCDMHIRPNSLSASLISRILILREEKFLINCCDLASHFASFSHLSRALFACRRSFSLRSFSLGSKSSSSSSSSSALEQLRDVLLVLVNDNCWSINELKTQKRKEKIK